MTRKPLSVPGSTRREDVGECEALVAKARRALATSPPHVGGLRPLLTDPCLVLENQTDALVFICMLNFLEKSSGSCMGSFCQGVPKGSY